MKVQQILPIVIIASLYSFGCSAPKTDGAAKPDGGQAAQTTPSSSSGTSTTPAVNSETTGAASTMAGIHVTDVLNVEGSVSGGGKAAPNFTWKGADGKDHSLKDYSGKVVMLNFWGTWCPPCRAELPDIVKLRKDLEKDGFEVIGLGLGEQPRGGKSPAERVAEFAKTNGLNYPLLLANEQLAEAYGGIDAVPTTFIVNGKGEIVEKLRGMQSYDQFSAAVKKAM